MLILSFSTIESQISVSIARNSDLIDSISFASYDYPHKLLLPTIELLLVRNKIEYKDIEYFSFIVDNSSFTQMRVNFSIGYGLTFTTEKPVFCFNALDIYSDKIERDFSYDNYLIILHLFKDNFIFREKEILKRTSQGNETSDKTITLNELQLYTNGYGRVFCDHTSFQKLQGDNLYNLNDHGINLAHESGLFLMQHLNSEKLPTFNIHNVKIDYLFDTVFKTRSTH